MRNNYFYVSSLPLGVGSVVEPGNWGRVINAYQPGDREVPAVGNPWLLSRELAFEYVRATKFPSLPSRFSCSFLFTSLEVATENAQQIGYGHVAKRLYRAELVNPDAPRHVGDFSGVDIPPTDFLPTVLQAAERYWAAGPKPVEELLTLSAIRLVEVVIGNAGGFRPGL